jgi:hypothetical protein
MANYITKLLAWLAESWELMGEAALWTHYWVNGEDPDL